MIKWYDELEKQIKEIQEEVDGIEAGEVDAKNLSEVLDKDAPIKLETDLQNNKVKVGLDIDNNTLEVDNGKLKVKQASGGKKYLHRIRLTFTNNKILELPQYSYLYCFFTIITSNPEAFTKQTLYQYMATHSDLQSNYMDFTHTSAFNEANQTFIVPYFLGRYASGGEQITLQIRIYTFDESITQSINSYGCFVSEDDSYWEVLDKVTEL